MNLVDVHSNVVDMLLLIHCVLLLPLFWGFVLVPYFVMQYLLFCNAVSS